MFLILAALTALTIQSGPQSLPVSVAPRRPITDPMFAASPQRELRRSWDDCVWGVLQILAMNERGKDEAAAWVFGGCADEESRLTGEMVRRFGYARGSQAMQRARKEVEAELERKFKKFEPVKERPAGFIKDVAGWTLVRQPDGCAAIRMEQVAPFYPSTQILSAPNRDAVLFQISGPQEVSGSAGKSYLLEVIAITALGARQSVGKHPAVILMPKAQSFDIAFKLTRELANSLRGAERVELRNPSDGTIVAAAFSVAELATVWHEVQQCGRHAAR